MATSPYLEDHVGRLTSGPGLRPGDRGQPMTEQSRIRNPEGTLPDGTEDIQVTYEGDVLLDRDGEEEWETYVEDQVSPEAVQQKMAYYKEHREPIKDDRVVRVTREVLH